MKHKRKKQIMRFMLMRWSQHKHIAFGFRTLRINDWYRLIAIVKRGGYEWLSG